MIDIVIVNWNAGDQLRQCVESVLAQKGEVVVRIFVVDNGSTDGSVDTVAGLPGVDVLHTGENLGFAAACNLGAGKGEAPYILFLNPDTALVDKNSLSVPMEFLTRPENGTVAICGIQLLDETGEISRTCARFPTLGRFVISALGLDKLPRLRGGGVHMQEWAHDVSRQVSHVIGAFYLIRREAFQEVAGFEERFFVYLEDVDLSLRLNLAGYSCWYLAEAQAFHAGGGTSRQVKAHRLFYSLRSRLLYGFKHFPRWQAWCLLGVTGLVEPFTRSLWCMLRRDWSGISHTWSAYRMLWRGMGRILRGDGRFHP